MSRLVKRSDLRAHPEILDIVGAPTDDEYDALKQDIAGDRIYNAIIAARTHDGIVIVDGYNRWKVQGELHAEDPERHRDEVPAIVLEGKSDDDIVELGTRLNANRRQRTREQRREQIRKLLLRDHRRAQEDTDYTPRSDRHFAGVANVDHKTVGSVRAELESIGEIPQCPTRQTSDGRSYPSERKPARLPTTRESNKLDRLREMREAQAPTSATFEDPEELRTCPGCGKQWSASLPYCPYCNHTPEARIAHVEEERHRPHDENSRPAPATAENVRRHFRRPVDARVRELIAAAQAMEGVDDDDLSALQTNDLMIAGLRRAVEQVERIINLHPTTRGENAANG